MDLSTLPTIKILVVDDHPNTARTLARAISQIGPRVEVFSATSGIQALDYAKDGVLDILITDMIMPEMTGLELIEQLQKLPAGKPTFSYLITAYEVPGLQVSARRLKVRDIIIKPVHPERICQIVSQSIREMDDTRPAAADSSPNKLFNILIADDQPDNLMLLSDTLTGRVTAISRLPMGWKHSKKSARISPTWCCWTSTCHIRTVLRYWKRKFGQTPLQSISPLLFDCRPPGPFGNPVRPEHGCG